MLIGISSSLSYIINSNFYRAYGITLTAYFAHAQEYNICFTTVERRPTGGEVTADGDLALPDLPDPSLPAGVLPTQVLSMVFIVLKPLTDTR